MQIFVARLFDPAVENAEVELPLAALDLLPRHRHKYSVEMQARHRRQDCVGLRGGSGRRVAKFSAKEDYRLAVYNELASGFVEQHKRRSVLQLGSLLRAGRSGQLRAQSRDCESPQHRDKTTAAPAHARSFCWPTAGTTSCWERQCVR